MVVLAAAASAAPLLGPPDAAAAALVDADACASSFHAAVPPPQHTSSSSSSSASERLLLLKRQRHESEPPPRHQQQLQQQLPAAASTAGQQQSSSPSSWMNGAKLATAGGIAGAFAKSCTAPLARLTILYQVQGFAPSAAVTAAAAAASQGHASAARAAMPAPPKLRHAFMQVVRTEGAAALWKGNLVTILHRLPYSSINFYTYENTTKLLRQQLPPGTSDFSRAWLSGAVAGLVACSAAYPLDLVRTRLAAQTRGQNYYQGIWPTLTTIVADEGLGGLYRGLGATLLQVVPSLALNFSLYDTIRSSFMAVHTSRQQRLALSQHSQQQQRQSTAAAGDSSSLAVASSVDQGLSLSQMLLWHLDDSKAAAAAAAGEAGGSSRGARSSSSSGDNAGSSSDSRALSAASAAAAAAEDAYATAQRRASHAAAGSSSSDSSIDGSSSSSSRVRPADVPAGISLASGCVSGFLTATATFPLDVIRRRMQVHGRHRQHHAGAGAAAAAAAAAPASYSQIIRQVMAQGRGLRGFYVGILPEYCKVVPGVAIAFCTYEQLKKWLHVV